MCRRSVILIRAFTPALNLVVSECRSSRKCFYRPWLETCAIKELLMLMGIVGLRVIVHTRRHNIVLYNCIYLCGWIFHKNHVFFLMRTRLRVQFLLFSHHSNSVFTIIIVTNSESSSWHWFWQDVIMSPELFQTWCGWCLTVRGRPLSVRAAPWVKNPPPKTDQMNHTHSSHIYSLFSLCKESKTEMWEDKRTDMRVVQRLIRSCCLVFCLFCINVKKANTVSSLINT